MVLNMQKGNPKTMGMILREVGYGKISKQPCRIVNSKGFQALLATLDDRKIVEKWYKWALSDTDRRVSLEAGKEILTLKDRYPDKNIRIGRIQEDVNSLLE